MSTMTRLRAAKRPKPKRPFSVWIEFVACGCGDMDGFLKHVAGRDSDGSGTELREGGNRDHSWQCRTLSEAMGLAAKLKDAIEPVRSFYSIKVYDDSDGTEPALVYEATSEKRVSRRSRPRSTRCSVVGCKNAGPHVQRMPSGVERRVCAKHLP